MSDNNHHDPATYRKLSEPYVTQTAAIEAMQAFWDEVRELRVKHTVPDLYLTMRATYGEGEIPFVLGVSAGNEDHEVTMLHVSLAQSQRDREERISALIKQVKERKR